MSQYDFGTINPSTTSGADLATLLGNFRTALNTWHSGTARPTYAVAGTVWVNTTTAPFVVNYYNGTTDIVLGTIHSTNAMASFLSKLEVTNKTANYTVVTTDRDMVISVDASAGAVTITLPLSTTAKNGFRIKVIKKDATANAVTISRSGTNLINGVTTFQLTGAYENCELIADGSTAWLALSVAPNSIGSSELIDSSVTTAKIADANVTNAKLATNAVTDTKIASNAVTTAKILDGAITFPKINSGIIAAEAEAIAGTANDKLMTPLTTSKAISANSGELLIDTSKPIYCHNSAMFAMFSDNKGRVIDIAKTVWQGSRPYAPVRGLYDGDVRENFTAFGNIIELMPYQVCRGSNSVTEPVTTDNGLAFTDLGFVYGSRAAPIPKSGVNISSKKVKKVIPVGKFSECIATTDLSSVFYIDTSDVAWGMGVNAWGELGSGNTNSYVVNPVKMQASAGLDFQTVQDIYPLGLTTLVLASDNRFYSIGWRGTGVTGNGSSPASSYLYPTLINEIPNVTTKGGVKRVFGIGDYTRQNGFIWFNNGELWGAGLNQAGVMGNGAAGIINTWTQLRTGVLDVWESNIISDADYANHGIFIRDSGGLKYAGYNADYTGLDETNTIRRTFVSCTDAALSGRTVSKIWFVNTYYPRATNVYVAFTDNTFWAIGGNSEAQGVNSVTSTTSLREVRLPFNSSEIVTVNGFLANTTYGYFGGPAFLVRSNGEVYVAGGVLNWGDPPKDFKCLTFLRLRMK